MMLLWIAFILCTAAIVYAGTRLSRYGDIIAEKTGMGRTWIGVVLMATVTSLPELVTGISSVTYAGVPDIAVGDVLGSCVFNMLILAVLDAVYRPMPISAKAHQGHALAAAFGILLLGAVALSLFFANHAFSLGWIGVYSLVFIGIYFFAMRMVYFYEKKQIILYINNVAVLQYGNIPTRTAVINYAVNAAIVIVAAMFLPKIGEGIAESTGLGQSFVGNIFIAMSTSLPEVVVSSAAVKMGAVDLAIGNLFGSNIFNILILGIDDILYVNGPLLSFVNQNHTISALSAVMMTAIAVIGLTYRAEKKPMLLAWDSVMIVFVFMVNFVLLYSMR
ncbi:MAG: sodium:proton exchanger [Nitrospirae bacterium CG_4_9_14_3_um_filter_53_35]|nr:MAG: sodium:proton exchanger [Nitrospirae bacterium CG17_big_fil_post_rev_8_21_14_2_50_50_9]PIW84478.1 MAG: sodium:proton exchanger [Nitrospirae bacterium CG_4_8_14_3_um_filter_50_41]PIX86984.1 MAG: sodium:proton exchanger [Nitrospirae bacterium CG_4_10_14_3_um_filter_53_41]PJA74832.1 MAG: sodium:proton exchanger [Nitrospirae bacterium CG_4_9_14_3_um_filter_53_35]